MTNTRENIFTNITKHQYYKLRNNLRSIKQSSNPTHVFLSTFKCDKIDVATYDLSTIFSRAILKNHSYVNSPSPTISTTLLPLPFVNEIFSDNTNFAIDVDSTPELDLEMILNDLIPLCKNTAKDIYDVNPQLKIAISKNKIHMITNLVMNKSNRIHFVNRLKKCMRNRGYPPIVDNPSSLRAIYCVDMACDVGMEILQNGKKK